MFLTYGNPLSIWKKWFPLEKENYIFIHNKFNLNTFWKNFQLPKSHIIPNTRWGSISLVRATLVLLHYSLHNTHCTHFVLLSDSCIPLYDFYTTCEKISTFEKTCMNHFRNIKEFERLYKVQSQWCIFTRKDAEYLIQNNHTAKYLNVSIPDEIYFVNELKVFTNQMTTFANFKERQIYRNSFSHKLGIHPKLYDHITHNDLNIARSKGALFMRKCHEKTKMDCIHKFCVHFDCSEQNIFKNLKQRSKSIDVSKVIDQILQCPVYELRALWEKNQIHTELNPEVEKIWNLLNLFLSNGVSKMYVL